MEGSKCANEFSAVVQTYQQQCLSLSFGFLSISFFYNLFTTYKVHKPLAKLDTYNSACA